MRTNRGWKSRVVDYIAYIAIGLFVVAVSLAAAVYISSPGLAVQAATAILTGCAIGAYVINKTWKRNHRRVLFMVCTLLLAIHLVGYAIAFRLAGVTKAFLAGPATVLEIALFSYVIDEIMRKQQAR